MGIFGKSLALAGLAVLAAGCHRVVGKDMSGQSVTVAGSYALTCRHVADHFGGKLTAECEDAKGAFHAASLQASECKGLVANMNGVLTCIGPKAP
jgi:hypothetical protein